MILHMVSSLRHSSLGGPASRLVAVTLLLFLVGCGDSTAQGTPSSREPGTSTGSSDPFVELMNNPDGTSMVMRAGLGDDLALIRADLEEPGARRPGVAAYRTPDGEWGELPLPDVFGDFDLAGVGDTVMIGGFECVSDDCGRLRPRFLVLDEGRRSWLDVPSDLPEVDVNPNDDQSEAGVAMAYPRVMDHAVFTLGHVNYAVDPDTGPVELDYDELDPDDNYGFFCLSDDIEMMVPGRAESADAPVQLDGVVLARDLHDAPAGFSVIAEAPQIEVDQLSSICGHRAIILHTGDVEHYFDLDTLQWTTNASNYMEVNGGITTAEAARAQQALPDGTAFDANRERSPDGTWSLLPPYTLVATRTGVLYGVDESGITTLSDVG